MQKVPAVSRTEKRAQRTQDPFCAHGSSPSHVDCTHLLESHAEVAFSSDSAKRENEKTNLLVECFRILYLMWLVVLT